jgi:hypothetical protein
VDNLIEKLKQLQALLAAIVPLLSMKFEVILPFLNPQISDELGILSAICAVIASLFGYNFSSQTGETTVGRLGFGLFLGALACLIVLVFGRVLETFPHVEDIIARVLYVALFVGLGLSAGWGFSILLPLRKPTP